MIYLPGAVFLILLSQSLLWAGVVYEVETKDLTASPAQTQPVYLAVEGEALKIDSDDNGDKTTMIFRGDRQVMLAVDHKARQVTEINRASVDGITEQMQQMMQQLESQMQNMPPEMRAKMRAMMQARMPQKSPSAPAITLTKTGKYRTVNGFACDEYEAQQDREKWVLCTTPWDRLTGGQEAVVVMRQMADFYQGLMGSMRRMMSATGSPQTSFANNPIRYMGLKEGFPVHMQVFEGNTLVRESVLKSAKRQTFAPANFDPPAGYPVRQVGRQ